MTVTYNGNLHRGGKIENNSVLFGGDTFIN